MHSFFENVPFFTRIPNQAVSGVSTTQPSLSPSKQFNLTTAPIITSTNSASVSERPTSKASPRPLSSSTPLNSENQPRYSIPKSSYMLMKLKFPNFTKAASWDSISDSYNNQTSQLAMSSESHGRRAVFPYLIHLGLGVKYAEWFEMQKPSHSMILHREQTISKSTVWPCVSSRASRV